ncbi:MAG: Flp pilus assembly protein CpaB [Acidimicrobiales bacterium]
MSSRRTLILIAAIAIGAIAAFALISYVGGIEDRANEQAERVPVFKVEQNIAQGTDGDQAAAEGLIVESRIPREFLPTNALTTLDQISGLVAVTDLAANQVVVEGMFVDPSTALISFSQRLESDEATVTVSVDNVRGVANLLVPGDRVNILVNGGLYAYPDDEVPVVPVGPGTPDSPGLARILIPYGGHYRYLYQDVRILAVDQSAVPQPGETVDAAAAATRSGLITFAVPPEAVSRIASATDVYLSLVSPDFEPAVVPMWDPYEVLPGEDPTRLTPFGPDGRE